MRRRPAFLLFIILLAPLTLYAQTAVITGTVTTEGSPLPGATVAIEQLGLSAMTDANGRYSLEIPASAVRGQSVRMTASFQGLQARTTEVTLSAGAISRDFSLIVSFGEMITVGSRAIGAAEEKAVPVDVISEREIETTASTETSQIIQAVAPSFNFPRTTITDGTDTVRPATLRGLGPDQMLVMINGKRRHSSALVNVNNSVGRGSAGTDLNAIPASAIQNIEVLRDGAAAQYGSDAIAGVINLVLKSGDTGGEFNLKGGVTSEGDGELLDVNVSYGTPVGRGSLFGTLEFRDRGETNRANPDPRDQIRPGDAGNNPVAQPNHHWGDSEQTDYLGFLNFSAPVTANEKTILYAFGGASKREGSHGGFYRRALDARNVPSIYPLGFLPLIEPDVEDQSLTGGMRGDLSGLFWDASLQYGRNSFDFNLSNTLNASLGPSSPTEFYAGGFEFSHVLANVDFSRGFAVGLASPLNVAFGAEFRDESYQINPGEPDSYRDGGVPNQFGGRAAAGAQVFPGFRPSDAIDASRSNYALYADLEGDVLQKLRVGIAGRFEDYDDFGSTSDYKLTARYAPIEQFVVRSSISTGFRAPSLGQRYFSAVSTNFLSVGGQLVPVEVGTFKVDSPVARALGAVDLKPEDSNHLSAGLVWQPVTNLELTADFFHIEIDDRIVFSENFTGALVAPILAPFGVSGARFFTNAIDTETDGFDFVANYNRQMGSWGRLDLSGAYSRNETEVVNVIDTPVQLRGLEEALFGRIERRRIECGQPKDNLRFMQQLQRGGLTATLRESRYGEFCSTDSLNRAEEQTYAEQWVADFDLGYEFARYTLGFGVQNLFDSYPDKNKRGSAQAFNNIFPYPRNAPAGMNGRFFYTKVGVRF